MSEHLVPPFPIFLNLKGAEVLIVGNNDIAARRAEAVLRAGAKVIIAAEKITPPINHLLERNEVSWLGRSFETEDVNGKRLIMVATENQDLNAHISDVSQIAGIPVNIADSLSLCTFIMPAIVDRAPITAAISSGGVAPILSRRVKTAVEAAIPPDLSALAKYAGNIRTKVNSSIDNPKDRRKFWQHFADGPIASHIFAHDQAAADREVECSLARLAKGNKIERTGQLILLGTGAGHADLLSLRALRLMQHGDMIFHEPHVSAAILNLCRKDAERISEHSAQNTLKLASKLAEDGLTVLWITCGPPADPKSEKLSKKGIVITKVPAAG